MGKLIDASDLYEAIEDFFNGVCVYDVAPSEAVSDFQSIVDAIPPADPESILNGEWNVHIYKYGMDRYECSECAQTCDRAYKYCPHCGAKMDLT